LIIPKRKSTHLRNVRIKKGQVLGKFVGDIILQPRKSGKGKAAVSVKTYPNLIWLENETPESFISHITGVAQVA
jgi:hypothetical protein